MSIWDSVLEHLVNGSVPIITFTDDQAVPVMREQPAPKAAPKLPRSERWTRYARRLLMPGAQHRPRCLNCHASVTKHQLTCSEFCTNQTIIRYEIAVRLLKAGKQDARSVIAELEAAGLATKKTHEGAKTTTIPRPEKENKKRYMALRERAKAGKVPAALTAKPVRKTVVEAARDGVAPVGRKFRLVPFDYCDRGGDASDFGGFHGKGSGSFERRAGQYDRPVLGAQGRARGLHRLVPVRATPRGAGGRGRAADY